MAKVKLEIESDSGPVVNTFNRVQDEIRQTQGDAKNLGKTMKSSFGDAAKSASALRDKIKSNGDEIKTNVQRFNETSGVIGKLIEKERQLTALREKSNSTALIKKYNTLIDETRKKMTELTKAQKEVVKTSPFETIKNGITSVFGGNILFAAVSKVTQAFSEMIQNNVALDRSIKNLSAITGASGKDLEFYGEQANIMGQKIQGGAVAAVEAFKLIGSAKPELLKNKEALVEVTDAAVTLSQASGLTLPQAAENLGNALNAFGAPAQDASKFINVLAASAQLGAKEIPFVTEALSKFGGVAKQANVSIEESSAAIEILGAKIPEASIVGTNLRGVLIKLQVLAQQNGREFKGLGKELELLAPKVKDVTFLKEKFGDENLLAIQTLIAEREALEKLTGSVEGTNAALELAAINTDTMAQSAIEAENAYTLFTTALGDTGAYKAFNQAKAEAFNDLAALITGTFGSRENIQAIVNFGKANEKQAQVLDRVGLSIKNLNNISKQEQGVIDFLRATDLLIGNIKDEQSANGALKGLEANLKTLDAQYKTGIISLEDYTLKLKILQIQTGKAKVSQAQYNNTGAGSVTETIGLIDQLQKDIEQLTTKRTASKSISEIFGLNDQIIKKQEELNRLLGNSAKELIRIQGDFDKALADLQKKAADARAKNLTGEEWIFAEQNLANDEIQIEQEKFVKLGKLLDKNFHLTEEQLDIFRTLRLAAEQKAADDLIKLELDKQEKINSLRLKNNSLDLTQLDANEQGAINSVNASPNRTNLSDAQFEDVKQRRILDVQEKYAKARLELKLRNNDDELRIELQDKTQDEAFLKRKYEVERQIILNENDKVINDIKEKRDKLQKEKFSLTDFYEANKVKISQFQGLTSEIEQLSNAIYDSKNKVVDQELQKNQELIDARTKNIEDLKNKLGDEYDLREAGHANNLSAINKQIEEEERLRQEALAQERKVKAEKARLAKDQLNLDTIVQASNLVVAATQIFATVAHDPYSLSIAVATVAAMLGAFAFQKVKAYEAVNKQIAEANKYAEGGIAIDGPGTETSDSIPARLSKGESVITAKKTRQHRRLLEGIHEDDDRKIHLGVLDLIRNQGISLQDDLPEVLAVKKEIVRQNEINAYLKTDNSRLEKRLDQMTEILTSMMKDGKNKEFIDHKGNLVKRIGSHTTIFSKQ